MSNSTVTERLDSWKEIAAYLRRDVRTVQRWEKKENLPVHRHQHEKLGSVYAFRTELTQWFNDRQPVVPTATPKTPDKIKIAVLPFQDLGGNEQDKYFADGLTEEMTTEVARMHPGELAIVARTTAERYEATAESLAKMKQDLGVDYVLEGKVRRSGNRVRITARLSEVQDQTQMWAENYERDLSDVLSVQAEIAQAIASEINVALNFSEITRLSGLQHGCRVDPEAYDAYLKGRYHLHAMTSGGLRAGVDDFERATQLDSNYAPAHAGLATGWALLAIAPFDAVPPHEAMPKAEAAAKKALELDQGLAEARAALALVHHHYYWDWVEAERNYRKAIELNPDYAAAHLWYSWMLLALGKNDEAFHEMDETLRIVQETDPHRLVAVQATRAQAYYFRRDFQRAVEECEKALQLNPDYFMLHYILGRAYRRLGDTARAIEQLKAARDCAEDAPLVDAVLGLAYATSGQRDDAQKMMDSFKTIALQRYIPATYFGMLFAGMGDKEQAFKWLEKAYSDRADGLTWLSVEPMLDGLRDDPRFDALVRRIGLTKG